MTYSPLLAIITAAVEIGAAAVILPGRGRKPVIRAIALILLLLAFFQILEVLICFAGVQPLLLSRISYMTVVWLPPAGLLLIRLLTPGRKKVLSAVTLFISMYALYLTISILLNPAFVQQSVCRAVFAVFHHQGNDLLPYCIFYWLGISAMLFFSFAGMKDPENPDAPLQKQMFLGTLGFTVPSLLTVLLFPSVTRAALPSIMCHYALFLALALIYAAYLEKRISRPN